ncbi:MAG: helix-turn-helix transcriptional regulator [Faecalibacterium sp.]|nr:helix-turn-helix transcriptional regulator [Faecalibacterium sp.]
MPRKALEELTESMFYLLMAFCKGPMCGIDAALFIEQTTHGRVRLGPATLYTILGKFEKEGYLQEIAVDGRKRTYCITRKGLAAYQAELQRLTRCVADAQALPAAQVQTADRLTAAPKPEESAAQPEDIGLLPAY